MSVRNSPDLLEQLYLSAVDDGELKPFLSRLAMAYDASLASFATMDGMSRHDYLRISRWANQQDYECGVVPEHYAVRSPFRPIMLLDNNFGRVLTSSQMVSKERRARDTFINEFLKPTDHQYLVTAIFAKSGNQYNYFVLNRGSTFGEFDDETAEGLQALVPHFRTMLRIRNNVVARERHIDFSHMLADRRGDGLVLINRLGKVHSMNARAAMLLARSDGLMVKASELAANSRDDTERLKSAIRRLLAHSLPGSMEPGVTLTVRRPSGAQPFRVHIMPLSLRKFLYGGDELELAVQIVAPEMTEHVVDDRLATQFGLSPMEVRVAAQLVAGVSPKRIAEMFGNSINTIHAHRKGIYRKLGVNRHFDLVRMFHGWPGSPAGE